MTRPVVLLPPSKGKAEGGDGGPYGEQLGSEPELAGARGRVLRAAVDAADELDDRSIARLTGVKPDRADAQRPLLARLGSAPTMPAHRRYTGVVHAHAQLADLDPASVGIDVRIVSALLGLAGLDAPVPDYRLEFGASLPPLGGLGRFWREQLADHLAQLTDGVRVWDLLPGEHAVVWPTDLRADRHVVTVRFVRPDGRVAPAARVKIAKGRLLAALIAAPDLEPVDMVSQVDLGATWSMTATGDEVVATDHS